MKAAAREVAHLRRAIASADREIQRAIVHRLELSRRVGRTKARYRLPLRNFRVEAEVVDRWTRGLAGIDPSRSEALARWLIEESLRVQESVPRSAGRSASAQRATEVTIIGGSGAMGRWLAGFLEAEGHRVSVVDPRPGPSGRPRLPDVEAAASRSKVVIFATPMGATLPLLRRAIEEGSDPLIFDILSVKAPIARDLARAARSGLRVTSVHPLFGPSARTLSGRNLLIVRCGNPDADAEARRLFAGSALSIAEIPLAAHDRWMAASLGLSHAVNLLFLGALVADPLSARDLARVASTTFHRQSSLARAVAREGADLYLDIQAENPHSALLYRELRASLDRLERIVRRRDRSQFHSLLAEGRKKLDVGAPPMRA